MMFVKPPVVVCSRRTVAEQDSEVGVSRPERREPMMSSEHIASCSCGALRIRCRGEPTRRSICHCDACRRRTGSAFSFNITFGVDQVTVEGDARTYVRRADSGRTCTFHFCPICGSTGFYTLEMRPGFVSVPAGSFGSAQPFEPAVSVYNHVREPWLEIRPAGGLVEG